MSNRRVNDIRDVINKLEFIADVEPLTELQRLLAKMFQFRVVRWLHGQGHPKKLAGSYVSETQYNEEKNDSLLRAKLLLRAASDSDLVPLDASFCLTVS